MSTDHEEFACYVGQRLAELGRLVEAQNDALGAACAAAERQDAAIGELRAQVNLLTQLLYPMWVPVTKQPGEP